MRPSLPRLCLLLCASLPLGGCEQLGIEDPAKIEAAREAEGRAVGGACRHSGRALEDCYKLNTKALKAAVYAGWRDMDAYMRENNIAVVPSTVTRDAAPAKKDATHAEEPPAPSAPVAPTPADKPAGKKAGAAHTNTEAPLTPPALPPRGKLI